MEHDHSVLRMLREKLALLEKSIKEAQQLISKLDPDAPAQSNTRFLEDTLYLRKRKYFLPEYAKRGTIKAARYVASTCNGYICLIDSEITFVSSLKDATKFESYRQAFESLDMIVPGFRCVVSEVFL